MTSVFAEENGETSVAPIGAAAEVTPEKKVGASAPDLRSTEFEISGRIGGCAYQS